MNKILGKKIKEKWNSSVLKAVGKLFFKLLNSDFFSMNLSTGIFLNNGYLDLISNTHSGKGMKILNKENSQSPNLKRNMPKIVESFHENSCSKNEKKADKKNHEDSNGKRTAYSALLTTNNTIGSSNSINSINSSALNGMKGSNCATPVNAAFQLGKYKISRNNKKFSTCQNPPNASIHKNQKRTKNTKSTEKLRKKSKNEAENRNIKDNIDPSTYFEYLERSEMGNVVDTEISELIGEEDRLKREHSYKTKCMNKTGRTITPYTQYLQHQQDLPFTHSQNELNPQPQTQNTQSRKPPINQKVLNNGLHSVLITHENQIIHYLLRGIKYFQAYLKKRYMQNYYKGVNEQVLQTDILQTIQNAVLLVQLTLFEVEIHFGVKYLFYLGFGK